ncbi:MAG TPA: hypothetical protein VFI99_10520 [Nocardioides sp.]|nr:hypothetical protein [Nocardioides sp.]
MGTPTYEVRLEGDVPSSVLDQLSDISLATRELRTVLTGDFEDQAALYGFLHRLRDFGLSVVEVRRVAVGGEPAGPDRRTSEDTP